MFDEAFSINHFDKMKITHISFDNFAAASSNDTIGVQEVQEIYLSNALTNDQPFILNFDGVDTGKKMAHF